jgi:hypothetical protein
MEELKIDIDKIGKGSDHYEIAESCAVPFNRCIARIINNGIDKIKEMKKDPSFAQSFKNSEATSSLERLKNILDILRTETPYFAISRSFPHVIKAGEQITKRNSDYFLKRDYK